ncbi:peptidase S8 and S53, subtilisin, kexin, sedolisin [Salinispora tropica CNB-440]|uniref:Peptidase S8 and S53, subtilisin, kexin, sedolisin n=1 Tax=Salinispora tropica (strain ATCC BAA-916 / DSM 44818 / JCM 13857 / NBRC 105044 / CNB-440) TaxID=369723 RepID=A4X1K6_SALTO|nr:peptidase S8 and S53, subtilisin, kexin, sedolisin [Salinispora tropica CNB-440]
MQPGPWRAHPLPSPANPPRASPAPVVAAVFVGLWIVGLTVITQLGGWLTDQLLLVIGVDRLVWLWPVTTVAVVTLAGLPTLLLALLPRSRVVRAVGQLWLVGLLVFGALSLPRALPPVQHEAYLATLAGTAGLATLLIHRLVAHRIAPTGPEGESDRHRRRAPRPASVTLLGLAGGLALLLPWVWVGALGGLLETLLAVLAATAVGGLAAALLPAAFWPHRTADTPPRPVRLVLVGGLVAGVVLLLLGAGVGQSGAQLPLLLTLPPAGFALAALAVAARRTATGVGAAAAGLVGLNVFGPLAWTDPEEVSLVLADPRDVPFWVAVAAGVGFTIAVLLAIGYGVTLVRRPAARPSRTVAGMVAATLLVTTAAVAVGAGQPGLHGERLLVVLREQADLSGVPAATGRAGRDRRAAEVYRRLVETAERTQAGLRRELRRFRLDHTPYYLVNAIEVDGGPLVRAWLAGRPEVDRVLVNQRVRPLPAPAPVVPGDAPPPRGAEWNIRLIRADRVWSELGITGTGVTVGSSDSGVDGNHPALGAGFRGGDDSWFDPWNATSAPRDRNGHGTHTLGSAVGRDGVGVAPGATWTGCVNLDRNLGNPALYLDCLQFMLAPFPSGGDPFHDGRPQRAPEIITNSWSCPPLEGCDLGALQPAVAALAAAGILVVFAAGNSGPRCRSIEDSPTADPEVLTVGAVDRQRRVTDFSARGPVPGDGAKPDLVAPGGDVLSALPGGGYGVFSGTSMATPQVAGVAALMWAANPALIGDLPRTRQILTETATAVRVSGDRCGDEAHVAGAGLVDAYAAVRAAQG